MGIFYIFFTLFIGALCLLQDQKFQRINSFNDLDLPDNLTIKRVNVRDLIECSVYCERESTCVTLFVKVGLETICKFSDKTPSNLAGQLLPNTDFRCYARNIENSSTSDINFAPSTIQDPESSNQISETSIINSNASGTGLETNLISTETSSFDILTNGISNSAILETSMVTILEASSTLLDSESSSSSYADLSDYNTADYSETSQFTVISEIDSTDYSFDISDSTSPLFSTTIVATTPESSHVENSRDRFTSTPSVTIVTNAPSVFGSGEEESHSDLEEPDEESDGVESGD